MIVSTNFLLILTSLTLLTNSHAHLISSTASHALTQLTLRARPRSGAIIAAITRKWEKYDYSSMIASNDSDKQEADNSADGCRVLLPQHNSETRTSISTITTNRIQNADSEKQRIYSLPRGQQLQHEPQREPQPRQQRQNRIVGGDLASSELSKYMVMIGKFHNETDTIEFFCSGVLISRRLGLTAAHCLTSTDRVAFVNARNSNDDRGAMIDIGVMRLHPRYNDFRYTRSSPAFDIGFFRLRQDAPEDSKFMKVNVNPQIPVKDSVARVLGYGRLGDLTNHGDYLRQVDVPIVSPNQCARAYDNTFELYANETRTICAGYLGAGECDSCAGDSGGPLFQYDHNNDPVLIGLVVAGLGCASKDYPGIYARVSRHTYFIPKKKVTRTNHTAAIILAKNGTLHNATDEEGHPTATPTHSFIFTMSPSVSSSHTHSPTPTASVTSSVMASVAPSVFVSVSPSVSPSPDTEGPRRSTRRTVLLAVLPVTAILFIAILVAGIYILYRRRYSN